MRILQPAHKGGSQSPPSLVSISVFVGRGSSMCGGLWGSKYGCCCGGQFSCMDASVSRYLDSMISSGLGAIRAETVGPARDGEVVRPSQLPSTHSVLSTPMTSPWNRGSTRCGWLAALSHADIRDALCVQKTANFNSHKWQISILSSTNPPWENSGCID